MATDIFPPPQSPPPQRPAPWRWYLLLLVAIAVIGFWLAPDTAPPREVAKPAGPPVIQAPPVPKVVKKSLRAEVEPGATITSMLGDYLSAGQILQLGQQAKKVFPLSRIKAGQGYRLELVNGALTRFSYDIDQDEMLVIDFDAELNAELQRQPIPYQVKLERVSGTIDSNLFEAVATIGETPEFAIALADIFAWDIDFILDIRSGDRFVALVEKRSRDGEEAGYGQILAAEFYNHGKMFDAFWYQDGAKRPGYYDRDGRSVRKAFLRAPLEFSRISSGFSLRRFHPIAKTWRAHPAIDYAAPTGTPIKAVGDGVINRIGYTRGNGNFIGIRHNSTYKTLYLHMSRFARKMKKGRRVSQGQVIGYVGSTGLATGPHLCFRMYRNGSPVNPTRVRAPAAAPVSKKNRTDFESRIKPLIARLEQSGATLQASLPQPPSTTN